MSAADARGSLVLSQRLAQSAFALVQWRLAPRGEAAAQFPANARSAYLGATRTFPAMLQFNGPAVALEMLGRKSGGTDAAKALGNDLYALIRRIETRDEPFERWRDTFCAAAPSKHLETLRNFARNADVDAYVLLHHRIALAATWLKHYAELVCPDAEKRP
ncbi:MAG TPA: type III-B CRISPR module-associated protein Cmr5 [Tahibacter sp.]|nr:type III-B CRISPR module-associated protein Cmr5 [Tahibacter sp.]